MWNEVINLVKCNADIEEFRENYPTIFSDLYIVEDEWKQVYDVCNGEDEFIFSTQYKEIADTIIKIISAYK